MKKILILSLLSTNLLAQQVSYLDKDQKAPYAGYLFDLEAEKKARISVQEADIYKERSKLLDDQNKLLQEKVNIWVEQARSNAQVAVRNSDDRWWRDLAFFGLGAAATMGAGYLFYKVAK